MNYLQRTDAFWQWFGHHEEKLSDMVESHQNYKPDEIVDFVSQGVNMLAPGTKFNMGGDYEFTFAVEGQDWRFYLFPYVVSRMPQEYAEKWRFFPCMQSLNGQDFGFGMNGQMIQMSEVQVLPVFLEEQALFTVRFYHPTLAEMGKKEALHVFTIMMELCLGEGFANIYVAEIEQADAPLENAVPLSGAEKSMKETLFAAGKPIMQSPSERYTGYQFQPQENQELRFDIIVGSSCYMGLVQDYYAKETRSTEGLAAYGAKGAFLAFAFGSDDDRKEMLAKRYELEDWLEAQVLGKKGSSGEIGMLVGGAAGTSCMYTDLVLYDEEAFLQKARTVLKDFSRKVYYSDFRQGAQLVALFAE